mmetsp:Transcript_15595/g.59251  ORF Transcript_15595/g.59251 Transcript_15595/m.59251 type:complete len:278 (-) Transcript_15595:215-1048(-)
MGRTRERDLSRRLRGVPAASESPGRRCAADAQHAGELQPERHGVQLRRVSPCARGGQEACLRGRVGLLWRPRLQPGHLSRHRGKPPVQSLRERAHPGNRRKRQERSRPGRARRSAGGFSIQHGGACRCRYNLHHGGGCGRKHGEPDTVRVHALRLRDRPSRPGLRSSEPRISVQQEAQPSKRLRSGEATLPDDHARLHQEARGALHGVRSDGGLHAAAGAGADRLQHGRFRIRHPGSRRRGAVLSRRQYKSSRRLRDERRRRPPVGRGMQGDGGESA